MNLISRGRRSFSVVLSSAVLFASTGSSAQVPSAPAAAAPVAASTAAVPAVRASTQAAQAPSINAQAQSALSALVSTSGVRAGPSMQYDPQIVAALLDLLNVKDNTRPSNTDFTQTSLANLLLLGTPEGFQLRNRYTHLGISLAEDFSYVNDPRLLLQLLEEARWERVSEVRAAALIALAARKEPQHLAVFHEALLNPDAGVRFAALEALEVWGRPEAKDQFTYVLRSERTPIIRLYAAQALARLGDSAGFDELHRQLENNGDWVAQAMAANFLGDLGTGDDYDLMLNRISVKSNDFVLAESAIAALKLFPKKSPAQAAAPPPAEPQASIGTESSSEELAPLVVTAPRLKIPPTLLIDGRVNSTLMTLLQNRANSRPNEADLQDPSLKTLQSLSSPVGFMLMIRYTELGFLLTEGLAGTADLNLKEEIVKVAQQGANPSVRAAALLAVAYDKDPADQGVFQQAVLSQDITVRFGAMEAMRIWNKADALQQIRTMSMSDLSLPVQTWASGILLRSGDQAGRDMLVRLITNQDWLARAMAYRYLGEMGISDDFDQILLNLQYETNNFVRSEMLGALLRLYARGAKKNAP